MKIEAKHTIATNCQKFHLTGPSTNDQHVQEKQKIDGLLDKSASTDSPLARPQLQRQSNQKYLEKWDECKRFQSSRFVEE